MADLLDLNLMPVSRYARQDAPELLGLHTAEPPRRAARGRGADRLVLYLAMYGNALLPPGKQDQVLADLAALFYATPGSVTAAMRTVAEQLNRLLLDRNLRLSSSGKQGLGSLAQVVLRDQNLYLAQSGLIHAYLITAQGTRDLFESELSELSLGQGRAAPISYHQTTLQSNDTLLLAAQPSPSWDYATLSGVYGQGPESMRRRLYGQPDIDLNAVLIQARSGKGKFYLPRAAALQTEITAQASEGETGETIGQLAPGDALDAAIQPQGQVGLMESTGLPEGVKAFHPDLEGMVAAPAQVELVEISPEKSAVGEPRPVHPAESTRTKTGRASVWAALTAIGRPIASLFRQMWNGLRKGLVRILPAEPFATIPSTVMAFIAVAVPIVLVTVSSVTYFRLGQAAQYDRLYSEAQQMAIQAIGQSDILARRADWERTLEILGQVETFKITSETQALRAQARNALDELELVKRVNYLPAISGGLPASMKIVRLVVSEDDVYMLDETSGSVYLARAADQGFEIDHAFQCGPNVPGITLGGSLIDLAAWPAGYTPEATVLALDQTGNLLFCSPDSPPNLVKMAPPPPPAGAWGNLKGFSYDLLDLYLLDPPAKAVWVFPDGNYTEQPYYYFDEEIPEKIQDMVDILVDRNDLYLLQSDGQMILCFSGVPGVIPTRCAPISYVDARPGRENTALTPPAPFSQLQLAPPPDPSLFILEPHGQAIYQFSLRLLVFQRQFLPEKSLGSQEATAFAVNTLKRNLFLATGNEIYYAIMP
jgi:hypothetical protein